MKIDVFHFLCFALLSTALFAQVQQDEDSYIYPELDKQLCVLWLGAKTADAVAVEKSIVRIKEEWENIRPQLIARQEDHINFPEFCRRIDGYLASLDPCLKKSNYSCIESVAYHLLFEFRSLRQCLYKTEYPLDLLWESIDDYNRIRKTINDRMFDLREWFEFEDQINDFICTWEYYDLRHIDEIHAWYPGIRKAEHRALKDNVNSCLVTLMESVETGFQSNFVLPCDELGDALEALVKMYSESRVIMLM